MSEDRPSGSSRVEHQELRDELFRAQRTGGQTGEAATAVMKVLFPHMVLEEEYAMPPLKLLQRLARGDVPPEMTRILPKTETLKAELPKMLEEHKQIVKALRDLIRAATEEKHTGFAQFATKMIAHAQLEEEMLYPAAILVGEYIKLKLGKTA